MGIIKCEKVFAGIFILIENKLEKLKKSQQKLFRMHEYTHFNNIYIVLFSFTQIIQKQVDKVT